MQRTNLPAQFTVCVCNNHFQFHSMNKSSLLYVHQTHSAQGEGLSRSPGNSGRAALEEEFSSEEEAEL